MFVRSVSIQGIFPTQCRGLTQSIWLLRFTVLSRDIPCDGMFANESQSRDLGISFILTQGRYLITVVMSFIVRDRYAKYFLAGSPGCSTINTSSARSLWMRLRLGGGMSCSVLSM